jgi:hypothetical protein
MRLSDSVKLVNVNAPQPELRNLENVVEATK